MGIDEHAVGVLCGTLGITPGQWLLVAASYNAELAADEIDKALAAVPALL